MRSNERNTPAQVTAVLSRGGVGSEEASPGGRPGMVHRMLDVLGAFSSTDPVLGISEIARRSGLPKSTVHRIVAELCEHRLMERGPSSPDYRLGIRLFELGELVPVHRSLSEAALPIMEDLREATRHRVHLAVLDGLDVLYVAILGSGAVHVDSRVGGRLPAHATGVGKVLLAYADPTVVRARIDAGLRAYTARTITSGDVLDAELRKIRTHGFALDIEESTPGVLCVAAPVFGADRTIRAGLSVTGITRSIDPGTIGPAVRTAAFTLTRALRDSGL